MTTHLASAAALAQAPRPSDEPLELPDFAPQEEPEPPPPSLPPGIEVPPEAPGAVKIEIRDFRFEGNTAFSTAQLREVAFAYLGTSAEIRAVLGRFFAACGVQPSEEDLAQLGALAAGEPFLSMAQLLELRRLLTLLYVNCGYVNSGVVLPDQRIADGIIRFRIVEGRLARINISGTGRLRESYVRERLELGAGPPLNIRKLEDRFRILLQDPLIERMNARLGPGTRLGESVLDVDVTPAPPADVALIADNYRAPSIGAERGLVDLTARNVTGLGDTLGILFGGGEGGPKVDLNYALPLTANDTMLRLRYLFDQAVVVEPPLDELDIESDTWTAEIGVSRPFYRTPTEELMLEARLERRHSQTQLLDRPFSFSPGVVNGESDITVLRAVQQWTDRGPDRVIAARSTFSLGLEAFGATDNPGDLPDGQYLVWLGQAQVARRWRVEDTRAPEPGADGGLGSWLRKACGNGWLAWYCQQGVQLILRGDVQLADDPLLPIEQFAVGGGNSVRGYPENQLVRDSGVFTSIESRVPLYPLPLPFARGETAALQLAPFFDYGAAWNYKEPKDHVSSIGLGLVWDPTPWFSAQIYWGYALENVIDRTDNYLQDHGISFQIVLRASDAMPQRP